jgi:polysaccharide biosynthesis transport protein
MDLGQAFAAARRHWLLLLVLALLGLGGGVTHQLLAPKIYRSTATVFFSLDRGGSVSELNNGNNYVQDLVPSYTKVATMPIVLAPVISDLGLQMSPGRLANKITITLQPASVIAQIAVTDTNPDLAASIANAVADRLTQALTTLSPKSSENTAVISVTTLSHATAGTVPISPSRNNNLGAGLLAGLIIGLVGVAVRESIVTQPLTTRAEIERVTDVPVIGSIVADPRAGNRPLPMSSHPKIARSESFRILQTTLAGLRGDAQCFVVASSLSGEGRSSTALNLAIAMSHASRRVLLIDADLRKPSIAGMLGIDNSRGLTSILSGTATPAEGVQSWVTQPWGQKTLDVIPAGPLASQQSELLASSAMSWLLETVREEYDMVVVDSPPLLQSTDGALLSAQVDYTLMLVDAPRTKERHLVESLARLRMAGADVLGIVINRTAATSQLEYPSAQSASVRGPGVPAHRSAEQSPVAEEPAATVEPAKGSPAPGPPGQPPSSRPATVVPGRAGKAASWQVPVKKVAAPGESPPTQQIPVVKPMPSSKRPPG